MESYKISCIMSVYKENKKLLKRSIDSILNQTFDNFEFIIILDYPKNKEAEDLIRKYQSIYKDIIFIKNKKNIWLWFALNKWILISKWKYIARMDADDYSYPNRFETQFNFLENNNNIDVLFPSYEKIFPNWKIEKYICKNYNLKKTFLSWKWHLNWWMMIKSSVFKENLYRLPKAPEEFELFIRLIKKWVKFQTQSDILYKYIISEKDIDYRYQSNNYWNREFLKLLIKNFKLLRSYSFYYKNVFRTLFFYLITRNKYIFSLILKLKNLIGKIL